MSLYCLYTESINYIPQWFDAEFGWVTVSNILRILLFYFCSISVLFPFLFELGRVKIGEEARQIWRNKSTEPVWHRIYKTNLGQLFKWHCVFFLLWLEFAATDVWNTDPFIPSGSIALDRHTGVLSGTVLLQLVARCKMQTSRCDGLRSGARR